jgi:dCTP deaminase
LKSVIVDGDDRLVDCASYMMRVGNEFYVTPTDDNTDAHNKSLSTLEPGQSFAIPPGQFAYIITQEAVTIPTDILAFISIRANVKWKGLVNVSGFHVDPGYHGRLTFAVFNAGPASIHLRSGDPVFLIWFASLDKQSDFVKKPKDVVPPENSRINVAALAPITSELHSLYGLAERIKNTKDSLDTRVTALERTSGLYAAAAGAVLTVCAALFVKFVADLVAQPSTTAEPASISITTPYYPARSAPPPSSSESPVSKPAAAAGPRRPLPADRRKIGQ